ncbi:MAG: DUF2336 domain-containing protein, partial [Kiloniellales bacterium]|nr:DUF2336 domain-containing protein [Kiloniellales bacterium]
EATMAYLVEEAKRVDSFHEPLVNRQDLTEPLARKLYWWVAAALRQKILETFEIRPGELDDAIVSSVQSLRMEDGAKASEDEVANPSQDLAKAIAAKERITSDYLIKVLRRGEISLFEALFGEVSGLRSPQLQRILYDAGGERLAVTARALQISKQSFATIYMLTRGDGQTVKPRDLSRATKVFDSIGVEDAKEILGTWKRDNEYQDAVEKLWAGAKPTGARP